MISTINPEKQFLSITYWESLEKLVQRHAYNLGFMYSVEFDEGV